MFNERKTCLSCNSKKLYKVIDLGNHSFADRFLSKKNLSEKDPLYPLIVDVCKKCSFFQLRIKTKPYKRYGEIDYSYTSANSKYSRNHWDNYFLQITKKYKNKIKKILEIGSNDGYLTNQFRKGYEPICVDASPFMVKISRKKGLISENLIFNLKSSVYLKKKYSLQDLIIANNVFNHSDNPRNFLKGVKNLLTKNGVFIFEQPYFYKSLKDKKFDQIYHEHISYFTVKNLSNLLDNSGFKIISLSFNEYHGGSIRAHVTHKENTKKKYSLEKIIKKEIKLGIYKKEFFYKFDLYMKSKKKEILKNLNKFKDNEYTIAGIGAAAKANTILSYFGINNKIMDFITDGSKFKINKYTPKTRIKILSDDKLKKYKKIVCFLLAWNISKILKKKLLKINKNIKFQKI